MNRLLLLRTERSVCHLRIHDIGIRCLKADKFFAALQMRQRRGIPWLCHDQTSESPPSSPPAPPLLRLTGLVHLGAPHPRMTMPGLESDSLHLAGLQSLSRKTP